VENNALPNVTMDFKQTFMEIKPTPVVAYYASRGPSNGFPGILKPDIMACTWVIGFGCWGSKHSSG
jgi:hypothetical protein